MGDPTCEISFWRALLALGWGRGFVPWGRRHLPVPTSRCVERVHSAVTLRREEPVTRNTTPVRANPFSKRGLAPLERWAGPTPFLL
jgi:hypothetical protein